MPIFQRELINFLHEFSSASEKETRLYLTYLFQKNITYHTLRRILKKIRWSWRVPSRFQTYKYTFSNLFYYCEFLKAVQDIPMQKLKFIDEGHIVSKDLGRKKVLGIVNTRSYTKERTIHEASASLTVLCTLTEEVPVIYDYRLESNTQWDFADFVYYCCKEGYLIEGDVLIVDNASVHSGEDSFLFIQLLMDTFKFRLIKLPCYSPELNPAEFVFGKLKQYLRKNRGQDTLLNEVIKGLAQINHCNLYHWYLHCTRPKIILPDLVL